MGMSLDASISFGVALDEDMIFRQDMSEEMDGFEFDDLWLARKLNISPDELLDMDWDSQKLLRDKYPCPFFEDFAGTDQYPIRILCIHNTKVNAYYDPVEFSLDDLNDPTQEERERFCEALELLGFKGLVGSWLLYGSWG